MISFGNSNICPANIRRADVGIGPYINSQNRNLAINPLDFPNGIDYNRTIKMEVMQ